jgi:hypothetical protein
LSGGSAGRLPERSCSSRGARTWDASVRHDTRAPKPALERERAPTRPARPTARVVDEGRRVVVVRRPRAELGHGGAVVARPPPTAPPRHASSRLALSSGLSRHEYERSGRHAPSRLAASVRARVQSSRRTALHKSDKRVGASEDAAVACRFVTRISPAMMTCWPFRALSACRSARASASPACPLPVVLRSSSLIVVAHRRGGQRCST